MDNGKVMEQRSEKELGVERWCFLKENAWPLLLLLWGLFNGSFPNNTHNTSRNKGYYWICRPTLLQ